MEMSTNGYKIGKEGLVWILVKAIKKKSEFNSLDDDFIKNIVISHLRKDKEQILLRHPNLEKSKVFKQFVKEIRRILHDVYGVFNVRKNKREQLLSKLMEISKDKKRIDEDMLDVHRQILLTHRSTKERLYDYSSMYRKLFKIKPKSILDLGCGLNPISFPWMNLSSVKCIGIELTDEDCRYLNKYFSIMKKFGLVGEAKKINLITIDNLPKTDVCFLFKLLDNLETLELNFTKKLLEKIKSDYIIASFPTKTLSGKRLSKKRLKWFFKLINEHEEFETQNEVFYIIKNKKLINKL